MMKKLIKQKAYNAFFLCKQLSLFEHLTINYDKIVIYVDKGDKMFEYDGIKINYEEINPKGKESIIYLHGWGQNIEMMKPIANPFTKTHHILIIDLPGFGNSEEPKTVWSLDDYVEMIHALVEKLDLKDITIIGHSFGGKLALIYAMKYNIERLVLLASPYKKSTKELSTKQKILKGLKKVPVLNKLANLAKNYIGSTDYKNATPMMRDILVNHINTDLTKDLRKIKCSTLLIWGTNDEAVPYEDAEELEHLIKDSGLVTYEGCSHYAYLERLNQTISVLKSFLS